MHPHAAAFVLLAGFAASNPHAACPLPPAT